MSDGGVIFFFSSFLSFTKSFLFYLDVDYRLRSDRGTIVKTVFDNRDTDIVRKRRLSNDIFVAEIDGKILFGKSEFVETVIIRGISRLR